MPTIKMYATATCPFCLRAKQLLTDKGVGAQIEEIRVDLQPELRQEMARLTGRNTVPQIFIGERHVGGCDDLFALDARGELDPLLGVAGTS